MTDFKPINTQEEFNERLKDRLEQAKRSARDGWTSPDDLKAIEAKHKEELQKLVDAHKKEVEKYSGYEAKFEEQTKKIHDLEINGWKTRAIMDKHLTADAIEFLSGEDEESINASADRLLSLTGANRGFVKNPEPKAEPNDVWKDLVRSLPNK